MYLKKTEKAGQTNPADTESDRRVTAPWEIGLDATGKVTTISFAGNQYQGFSPERGLFDDFPAAVGLPAGVTVNLLGLAADTGVESIFAAGSLGSFVGFGRRHRVLVLRIGIAPLRSYPGAYGLKRRGHFHAIELIHASADRAADGRPGHGADDGCYRISAPVAYLVTQNTAENSADYHA